MYTPRLTDEEKELVNQLRALPNDRFQECMITLERHGYFISIENDKVRPAGSPDEYYLKQGRNKARYYAYMRLATATLELEEAKKELNNVMINWEKLEHDSPIYWDNVKTKDGWRKVLVGNAARDYKEEIHPNNGRSKLYLPHGEVVNDF